MTDELVQEALDRVAQVRKAIAAKRFDAVLLYHELEDLHRKLAEEFEMPEWLNQAKRDGRDFERRWRAELNSAKVRREKSKKKDCLGYIALRLREDPTIQNDFKRKITQQRRGEKIRRRRARGASLAARGCEAKARRESRTRVKRRARTLASSCPKCVLSKNIDPTSAILHCLVNSGLSLDGGRASLAIWDAS